MQFRTLEMADRELIAAILTAGIWKFPQSRAQRKGRPLTNAEADAIQTRRPTMPSASIASS